MDANATSGSASEVGRADSEPIASVVYDDDSGIPVISPADLGREVDQASASDTGKRKRGRPRGSTNSTNRNQKQEAQDLTGILLSLHMMAAAIAKTPELELEEAEAKRLGEAVARVNACYGNWIFTEKQMAWFNLMMAGGAIYGPRFVAYNLRVKKEREDKTITMPSPTVN